MSLISKRDREVALDALNFYIINKSNDINDNEKMELNALINWIKLEQYKNDH